MRDEGGGGLLRLLGDAGRGEEKRPEPNAAGQKAKGHVYGGTLLAELEIYPVFGSSGVK